MGRDPGEDSKVAAGQEIRSFSTSDVGEGRYDVQFLRAGGALPDNSRAYAVTSTRLLYNIEITNS